MNYYCYLIQPELNDENSLTVGNNVQYFDRKSRHLPPFISVQLHVCDKSYGLNF